MKGPSVSRTSLSRGTTLTDSLMASEVLNVVTPVNPMHRLGNLNPIKNQITLQPQGTLLTFLRQTQGHLYSNGGELGNRLA